MWVCKLVCSWLSVSRYARGHLNVTVQPSKNVVLVQAEISSTTTLAPCHHAEDLSHASKETADLHVCFRIIVGLFHPRRQLSNAVRTHWLSEGNVNNITRNLNSQ